MKTVEQRGKRKLWKKVLLGLTGIVLLLFIVHVASNYYYERQLQSLINQLSADDPLWRWDDRRKAGESLNPKDNAAIEVVELLKLTTLRETIPSVNRNAWGKALTDLYQKHSFEHYELFLEFYPNARMPAAMRDLMKPLMSAQPMDQVLPRARMLSRYQAGLYQHTFKPMLMMSLLPDVQGTRSISNLLAWDVELQILNNQPKTALDCIYGMLGIARSFDRDPFMISHLVRMAIDGHACRQAMRVLALSSACNEHQLLGLQTALEQEHELSRGTLQLMVKGDLAVFDHDMTELIEGRTTILKSARMLSRSVGWLTGNDKVDEMLVNLFPEIVVGWGNRPANYLKERYDILKYYYAALEWSKLPDHELIPATERWSREGPFLSRFIRHYFLMSPRFSSNTDIPQEIDSLQRIARAFLTQRVKLRCAIAAVAAERYRLKEGKWPATMADLSPGYLKDTPVDPFTNRAMIMKSLPDGLVIYSVGRDGVDDGGDVISTESTQPKDLGYRLWNPPQRSVNLDDKCNEFVTSRKAQ